MAQAAIGRVSGFPAISLPRARLVPAVVPKSSCTQFSARGSLEKIFPGVFPRGRERKRRRDCPGFVRLRRQTDLAAAESDRLRYFCWSRPWVPSWSATPAGDCSPSDEIYNCRMVHHQGHRLGGICDSAAGGRRRRPNERVTEADRFVCEGGHTLGSADRAGQKRIETADESWAATFASLPLLLP
jgi:hypothetical protein